ncbi:hypothetical protein [Helicobacter cetorum]|uniref:Transposase mutator type n=1 Tax=Helicobacter cetorum (strain ATCC BAA-540 / CCUG 52418 / MIT 99-5656) TaxID=1163745 RepID=I0ETN7_HELCM|nr:hypothetical protein [Helicobacter cetorum]AFI06306.1 transposase mutator type [Helicobacter cetorum MIT 99-5656]
MVKKIGGKDSVLAPLVKQLIEVALETEIETHIAQDVLGGNKNRKNGSFKCSLSFKLNSIKNHLKYNTNFLNKSLKNNFIPLILIVSSY